MSQRVYSSLRRFARHLPEPVKAALRRWFYSVRLADERALFEDQENIHDLPDIYHYWSNKYLRPKLEHFGFSNPEEFFLSYFQKSYVAFKSREPSLPAQFASIGSGNCEIEVSIAKKLVSLGCDDFKFECLELHRSMIGRGEASAAREGVRHLFIFSQVDINKWMPNHTYDAIMANQSLHHIEQLEKLFDAVELNLVTDGRFIVSDMIGRNGHQRWPEALVHVTNFWRQLPARYRRDAQRGGRLENTYINRDYSTAGFEGIRAQDILPLLVERFDHEFFIGFANVIDPFIDRGFGPNFDVKSATDTDFIDRVHELDEAEIRAGRIKPTHMMGVFRRKPYIGLQECLDSMGPQHALRSTQ